MATAPLSDELAQQAADALRAHGDKTAAARELDIPINTFRHRIKIAAQRGMLLGVAPAMPGFRISQVTDGPAGQSVQQKPEHGDAFVIPAGHKIKGVSALVNPDGDEIVKWIKTTEGVLDPLELAAALRASFVDYEPAALPAPAPAAPAADLLTLIPANDWHLGMSAWGKQVGVNWDLKIAESTIGRAIEDTIARSPSCAQAIVLGGGDLLHADNRRNETTNGTPQDVDGRYQKIVDTATRLMVRTIDAALRHHNHVTVRVLPGNHDEHATVAIAYFLLAWYRNETRVTVDADPSLFFWHRFGKVMLGATHGHTVKIDKMPGIMAARRAADWGATKYRYVHGFHLHHSAKVATENNGVICETHQAPIPQDAWHFGSGYLSGRSLQAITYHREFGEVSRVRTAIMDGAQQ
jgi:hypothetical protein